MTGKLFWVVFFVGVCNLTGYALSREEEEDIRQTASIIAGHFDSTPDQKYWVKLRNYGAQAVPIVQELIYSVEDSKRASVLVVFSQLRGNDDAVRNGLRDYLRRSVDSISDPDAAMAALYCLARKGNDEDVRLLRSFETHTNRFVNATSKSARIKLEQRLELEMVNKQFVVSQSIHTPVPNNTGVADKTSRTITPQEVVAPNVPPNQEVAPRKAFPYLVVIGGAFLVVIGSIFVVIRKRKSGK